MASTKADNNRVGWVYTDDDSQTYGISAKAVYVQDVTDGAKYGGIVRTTERRIPKDLKPRRVKCVASGKPDKWIVAYTKTATIWTTAGTNLTLDANGVDTTYTTTLKKRNETYRDTVNQDT